MKAYLYPFALSVKVMLRGDKDGLFCFSTTYLYQMSFGYISRLHLSKDIIKIYIEIVKLR